MGFDEVKRIMHQLVWAGLRNRYICFCLCRRMFRLVPSMLGVEVNHSRGLPVKV